MKVLCKILFLSLPGQSDLTCSTMASFQLDEYPWKPSFSYHIKFIWKPLPRSKDLMKNLSFKFLCDVIFSSLPGQCDVPSFNIANFNYLVSPGNQTSQITPNGNKNALISSSDLSENSTLKLLCNVFFLSLHSQSNIPCVTIAISESDEYTWKPNFQITSNTN